ncbi:MAG TPA: MBL fold metallo-hydrolase [Candidatus Rokubacteria bacterium]|nr:MAG: mRNA 3'-end processing factor [Candidatus Rokubacteria bacterium GWA2_73_35]HBH02257.1 MBL fold metallo-hydrolase [Candidatus Rokubacteria bacterium]
MTPALTFLGAAGTVTGAKFLLETGGPRLLLECGMFQGLRELRERNWQPPPVEPRALDAVLLSHAHIDHSGYLPRLARDGFAGPVYCSPGTADLLRIMLPDAARLQEEEAEYRNLKGATKHEPALPLFTVDDAERALALVRPVAFGQRFAPVEGVEASFHPAGHILGASIVEVAVAGHRLVYSGDLGRYDVPIMRDPEPVEGAGTLLVESTYGDRLHPAGDGSPVIAEAVGRAVARRGLLLIPSFAVGRTQEILYLLRTLEEAGRIPRVTVYLDSPMGIEATAVYALHPEEHDAGARRVAAEGRRPFVPARFHLSRTTDDSKRLNDLEGPAIVVAGSGMATGGRILHHLRRRLPDERTTVLFVGYQAAGTRGRLLRDGADRVRIFGEDVPVRAAVMVTDALSAHADRAEILRWLRGFRRPPAATWVVHGEPAAARALRGAVADELGWRCQVAEDGQRVAL